MTREGHIYSALMRRGEGVRVFPFEFDYKDGTPERIQASGQALLGMWDESVLTEAERSDVVVRCLVFGFCDARSVGDREVCLVSNLYTTFGFDFSFDSPVKF
jgi:hypothetical protein